VVYERIVVPWVDQYESKVDEAVDEAHRGVRRWLWSRFGSFIWLLIGEGGNFAEGLLNVIMGFLGCETLLPRKSREDIAMKPSNSTEPLLPRHSIKEALSQSSSFSEVDDVSDSSFNPSEEFVHDLISMLRQGLYVFANVYTSGKSPDCDASVQISGNHHVFEGGFKLGILSFTEDGQEAFSISPVSAEANGTDAASSATVVLPLDILKPVRLTGAQGLIFECHRIADGGDEDNEADNIRVEIVLSDESDRNILAASLNACLPFITCKKNGTDFARI